MKLILALSILLTSAASLAEISSSVAFTSDYKWRGETQTNSESAVQGDIVYTGKHFTFGTWASNVTGGSEVDFFVEKSFNLAKDFDFTFNITNYTYAHNTAANTLEFILGFSHSIANLTVAYTDDYFGTESSSIFYGIDRKFKLSAKNKLSLKAELGLTTFDEEALKDKTYYKLGFVKSGEQFDLTLAYTNFKKKSSDAKSGVSLTLSTDI